ncbi:MAG: hypothetical protein M3161_07565, partial [Actinomycetota bacterium]|nr:hypothetical protein [Actinomycetota bacterium]
MPTNSSDSRVSSPQRIASVVPLVPAWRVDRAFDYLPGEVAVEVGSLVRIPFGGRRVRGVVVAIEERVPERELERVTALVTSLPVMPAGMQRLFEWIAERYVTPRGRAYARAVPPRVRVAVEPRPVRFVSREQSILPTYEGGVELLAHLRVGGHGLHCIQVLPGTDRGALIAELLSAAQGPSLVAVPEVRYGSTVIDRLTNEIDGVVRLDSGIGDAERARGWLQFAAGSRAAVGGRSVVLAPSHVLRLIVVDE